MLLFHPASGAVLASKDPGERMRIASTTKLMTAIIAAELLAPDQAVEIKPEWTAVEGSSMYLRAGESYTVRELLTGLLLASGNDAALALAETAGGSVAGFVERMNDKCLELGLRDTHFDNPHGLDGETHYSTAADLARIMAEALRDDMLREIMAMRSCTIRGLVYENHNRLLRTCPGVFGGKTGYTMAAGRCLVSCCERDGLELVCVTLSDADDWDDHAALYDWAYGRFEAVRFSAGEEISSVPVISGSEQALPVTPAQDVTVCVPRGACIRMECVLPEFTFAPVERGSAAGEMCLSVDGAPASAWPLVWGRSAQRLSATTPVYRDIVDRFLGIYRV